MEWSVHKSEQDASVNFVQSAFDGGMWECRFVQRDPSYAIAYVSSHSGCRHACRFCHLTQTGQTMFTPSTIPQLIEQLDRVLEHVDSGIVPPHLNINFMARGEALSNPLLVKDFGKFAQHAQDQTQRRGMSVRYNISTIFPLDSEGVDLVKAFGEHPVTFYWSLYALDARFRKRWLPRAQDPFVVADRLRAWQEATGREIVFHWAFIEGENDSIAQVQEVRTWIEEQGLFGRFNLVRYNSHNARTGKEPDEDVLRSLFDEIVPAMKIGGSRIVPRVGFDVAASCGMFIS